MTQGSINRIDSPLFLLSLLSGVEFGSRKDVKKNQEAWVKLWKEHLEAPLKGRRALMQINMEPITLVNAQGIKGLLGCIHSYNTNKGAVEPLSLVLKNVSIGKKNSNLSKIWNEVFSFSSCCDKSCPFKLKVVLMGVSEKRSVRLAAKYPKITFTISKKQAAESSSVDSPSLSVDSPSNSSKKLFPIWDVYLNNTTRFVIVSIRSDQKTEEEKASK